MSDPEARALLGFLCRSCSPQDRVFRRSSKGLSSALVRAAAAFWFSAARSRWKQSCRRPPKVTNDWSEHAIVLLKPPRNRRMWRPSPRDIALRAKGGQPLAPPGEGSSSSSCSGSALPLAPPPAPPPPETPSLAKRSVEQETEMTDATVEQQGEGKRRREHQEAPHVADISTSSTSSESSTDTEVGLVVVCAILRDNSEAEGRCEVVR